MRVDEIDVFRELSQGSLPALEFSGVQCDSRRIRPGDIFVAVRGLKEDGREYITSAVAKGAVGVVSETPLAESSVPVIQVVDARRALACLAAAVNNFPADHLRMFGITGTNGKTTTAWLLRAMLSNAGAEPGLISTVNIEYSDRSIPAQHTTPDAPELHRLLAAMRDAGCDSAVMEVSSHALDQQRTAMLGFAGVAFTNLSQDHLDYHNSMEEYFQTKASFFAELARVNPGALALCYIEEQEGYGRRMAEVIRRLPLKLITYGFPSDADMRAVDVALTTKGSRFIMILPDGREVQLNVHLAGRYNVANMLCAAALALESGVPLGVVQKTLEELKPCWGRLERIQAGLPATIFVDYAHTDDALANVLATLREMTRGKLIVVFGCGGNRDRSKRPKMGGVCAAKADYLVVTSDNPRREDPMQIIHETLAGIPAGTQCVVEPDRRLAIRSALQAGVEGDVILVAGKGHEAFQELADRTIPFDDRQVVLEEAQQIILECKQGQHSCVKSP